jgi:hypothetical protein
MATEQKKQGKGKKLRRCSKHVPMYKEQFFTTERNKKRTLGRRIRHHPNDLQAIKLYDARYHIGSAGHLNNLTGKGRWLLERRA